MVNEEFEKFVFLEGLKNAQSFGGKANPKALIGRCVPNFPDMKANMKEYMGKLNEVCSKINEMDVEAQKAKLLELDSQFFEKKKEKVQPKKKDGLPELEGVENGVVVRFPPAPSGHLHLGHLFGIVANYELVKKYGGKFILRLEDTNPDNIDLSNYDKVIEDVKWICDDNVDEIYYQSDRLEIYYKYLRELVAKGAAFVCECQGDEFKNFTDESKACPHRDLPVETQIENLEKMFNGGYKEGEAVVRAMADLENKNPALRSFALARINETEHPRVKGDFRVWPNYNLAVSCDDYLMKLTHVIRGKDLEIGEPRQKMLFDVLGWEAPVYFHYGKLKFVDMDLSKSRLTEKINSGEFSGWDDPRVPSILAFKKKGYKAQAFREFILSLGISKRDSKITKEEYLKGLDYFNKQILEKESSRYFCIEEKFEVEIENVSEYPVEKIKIAKHPEDESFGFREIGIDSKYFVNKRDGERLEVGDLFRLMHFGNFEVVSKSENGVKVRYVSKEFSRDLKLKGNIHFVPENCEEIEIITSENNRVQGFCEDLSDLSVGDSVQFERFAFMKFDRIEEGKKVFYYTHK